MTRSFDWCVGLFEGEGCIYFGPHKNGRKGMNFCITVTMTDRDILQEFVDVVGLAKLGGPYKHQSGNPKHKDFYRWQIQSLQDCKTFLDRFVPQLCSRRAAKGQELLDYINPKIAAQKAKWT